MKDVPFVSAAAFWLQWAIVVLGHNGRNGKLMGQLIFFSCLRPQRPCSVRGI